MKLKTSSLASPIIKINEVSPLASPDWAELYCVDDGNEGGGVDISQFMLTDLDGEDTPFATSSVTVRTGQYIVVHWGEGEDEVDLKGDLNGNGVIDLYLEDKNPTNTDDQLLLVDRKGKWLDAVVWANQDGVFSVYEMEDVERLIREGQWKIEGEVVDEVHCVNSDPLTPTKSIGRKGFKDTDTKDDWVLFKEPTPGKKNPFPLPPSAVIRINEVSFKEKDSKDWIELYCVDDGGKEVALGGCYIKAGPTILRKIKEGTVIRKGQYLVFHHGKMEDDLSAEGDGVIDIFIEELHLKATDSQLIFCDPMGKVEDAVCWANQDGTWSLEDQKRVERLVEIGEWRIHGKKAREEDCVDSSLVKKGYSIARKSVDTNTKSDWMVDPTPSIGRANEQESPHLKLKDLKVLERYVFLDGVKNAVVSFILDVVCEVSVRVYDVEGRCVRVLYDREKFLYGKRNIEWDGLDDEGKEVPVGIYILCIEVVDHVSGQATKEKVVVVGVKDLD